MKPLNLHRPRPEPEHGPSLLRPLSTPELERLMATPTPTCHREPPVILLQKCPTCREYAPAGSHAAKRCLACNTPLPK